MTFVIPSDANQCVKLIQKSVDHSGPMCIRIARGAEPLVYTEDYEYEIGKAIVAHEGNDVTVVAAGCHRRVRSLRRQCAGERGDWRPGAG